MLTVNLAQRSYPIHIGHSIFSQKKLWQQLIAGSQICIVTNETIAPLYLSPLIAIFSEYQCDALILPDGEVHKNVEHWQKIFDHLILHHHKRNTTLIALGGGVIGDITGFAAACYQRGVNFIQAPTSLLAQVDASIGGKTSINYQYQKNLIGAFHQPKAVVIDIAFLSTLPEREFRAGLAEIVKYALIHDVNFLNYLCENIDKILARATDVLTYIVEMSVKIKIDFVEQDERDETGRRALLNFGHTFGHALESVMNFNVLHGEAVAWGMRNACQLSHHLGHLSHEDVAKIEKLLEAFDLLIQVPNTITANELLSAMTHDKKNSENKITFILLKKLGDAFVADSVDLVTIKKIIQGNLC
ncbi:MAG: 3-dehydroquinate synthase [Pseudomonadota bacterium]